MRTLNKTLCLVLALVMVLGMFGVATAADFTDDATIQYKEAVDVMTGIGSINGMGDGTFAPAGNVTRAQAAKMVAYAVLGADIAATLPVVASSFTDVDANFAWAIPSIEYLVKEGVIDGRGDGTFDPNGKITAYEIAKMLLAAAGYGKNGEFVGPSWALNVAIIAQKEGVFTGTKATDLNGAASREECALYCFNGLTEVAQVAYSKDKSTYDPVTPASTIANDVYKLGTATAATGLAKVPGDVNGQNGYYWYYKNATTPISALITAETVIGSSTDGTSIATLTTYSTTNAKYIAAIDTDTKFYQNGKSLADLAAAEALVGKGVLVEFVDTDNNAKTAEKVFLTTYVIDVVNAAPVVKTNTADGKDYVFIDMATTDIGGTGAIGYTVKASNVKGYTGLAKDDVVLVYTFEDGSIKIEKATAFTGKATAKATGSLTIDGKAYKFAKAAGTSLDSFSDFYQDAAFFTDSHGYLVFANVVTATVTDYAYVVEATTFTSGLSGTGNYAKLVLSNGNVVSKATIAAVDTYTWTGGTLVTATAPVVGDIYTYTVNTDGSYNLGSKTELDETTLAINKGVSAAQTSTNAFKGDANTVYVVANYTAGAPNGTFTAYTGYANAPTFTAGTAVFVNGANLYADVVFVNSYTADVASTDQSVFYLLSTSASTVYDTATAYHYEYSALVNGQTVALKVKEADNTQFATNCPAKGLYVYTTTNGYVNVAAAVAEPVSPPYPASVTALSTALNTGLGYNRFIHNTAIGTPANDMVEIGSTDYNYTASTVVFTINSDGTYSMGTINSVVPGTYTGVTAVTVATSKTATAEQQNTLYAIFIQKA